MRLGVGFGFSRVGSRREKINVKWEKLGKLGFKRRSWDRISFIYF